MMENYKEIIEIMVEEDIMSMKLLLKQYKKEYNDLENKTGLAKVMTAKEIEDAKVNLQEHISNLEKDLSIY